MRAVSASHQLAKSDTLRRLLAAINLSTRRKPESNRQETQAKLEQLIQVESLAQILQKGIENKQIDAQQSLDLIKRLQGINRLSVDTRNVDAKCVFIALLSTLASSPSKASSNSSANGHQYIQNALEAGTPLIVSQCDTPSEHLSLKLVYSEQQAHVAIQISVFGLRGKEGQLAKTFYFKSRNFADSSEAKTAILPLVTAVTGTNGKTSVASLFAQWISLLGQPSASIGTLGVNAYHDGAVERLCETINTTPDVVSLFTHIDGLSKGGSTHIAIEASSHGLVQKRLQDIDVNCAVFTNLSQDHLDYHHTMAEYGAAKRQLLQASNLHYVVLNADDPESQLWLQALQSNPDLSDIEPVLFSVQSGPETVETSQFVKQIMCGGRYCIAHTLSFTNKGCEFELVSSWGNQSICLPLIGRFNVSNFLAVASALLVQSFDFAKLMAQVKNLSGVSGRMELFDSKAVHIAMLAKHEIETKKSTQKSSEIGHNMANILVDYAHTPDALRQALLAARQHCAGELVCVFGCGGDRDKSKRAQMGAIADELADKIVLTQDNSRTEKPAQIIADIQQGVNSQHKVTVELDRKQAIKKAWLNGRAEDLILLAGKGHETYMEINKQRIDYDERAFVEGMFKAYILNENAHTGAHI